MASCYSAATGHGAFSTALIAKPENQLPDRPRRTGSDRAGAAGRRLDARHDTAGEIGAVLDELRVASAIGRQMLHTVAGLGDLGVRMRATLSALTDADVTAEERRRLRAAYSKQVGQARRLVDGATVDGVNLLRHDSGDLVVHSNPLGGNLVLTSAGNAALMSGGRALGLDRWIAELAAAAPSVGEGADGGLDGFEAAVVHYWERLSDDLTALEWQIDFLTAMPDLDETIPASEVDAFRARDAAMRTAEQVERLLSGQSVEIVNRQPQSLLALFR